MVRSPALHSRLCTNMINNFLVLISCTPVEVLEDAVVVEVVEAPGTVAEASFISPVEGADLLVDCAVWTLE